MEINAPTGRSLILAPPRRFTPGLDWEGRGADALLRRLEENLVKRGGMLLRGVQATRLIMKHGACVGLEGMREGAALPMQSRAVVIADGGFPANVGMIRRYITRQADRLLIRASRSATGDGLRMAEEAGARLKGFGRFYGHPVHRDAFTRKDDRLWPFPMIDALTQTGLVLGADGRRFTDEGRGGIALANAIAQLDDPLSAVLVFDDALWNSVGREGPTGNPMLTTLGATLHQADDITALAGLAGLPPAALAETVAVFNAAVEEGGGARLEPPRSMQPLAARPIVTPPFHALPLCSGITATMGGIAIDSGCRALRTDGAPIRGLYAAGSTVAGLEGGSNVAYLGGLSKAFILGLLAAEAIAEDTSRAQRPA
jgi:fumarate reductase flavoprotein subunit